LTVIKNFNQYKLEDFYNKRYYEGGVHLFQLQLMYEFIIEDKNTDYKFQAAVHGIDLDKELKKSNRETTEEKLEKQQKQQDLPIFGDPDAYDNYSEEEKERITKEMMGKHKQWASGENTVGN